jgi:predicted nucleotidyltransferase
MKPELDIRPEHLVIVKEILHKSLPSGSKIYVFGSRVKGTAKKYSDLDLAIDVKGGIPFALSARLAHDFEVSDLPYKVDVVDLNKTGATFKQIIEKECLPFPLQITAIHSVNHITLAVRDIGISFKFYKDVLGLQPLCRWDKGAYFLAGDVWFCLNLDTTYQKNISCTHYAFSVSSEDFEILSQRIIQSGTTPFKENTSPGASFYFLDPDLHKLEIHVGDWQSRVQAKKQDIGSWKEVEWFI